MERKKINHIKKFNIHDIKLGDMIEDVDNDGLFYEVLLEGGRLALYQDDISLGLLSDLFDDDLTSFDPLEADIKKVIRNGKPLFNREDDELGGEA